VNQDPERNTRKIRVENQPGIQVSRYTLPDSHQPLSQRPIAPFRFLFIKPWQESRSVSYGPPLGILTLTAVLRERFGDQVEVRFCDMKLYNQAPEQITEILREFRPDAVGVSALNCEARASFEIAQHVKQWSPSALTLIGGPFTLRQSALIFSQSCFDWVFEGAADRTLPEALARYFSDQPLGDDLAGFSYRDGGTVTSNTRQDLITDMDAIPLPAWDLVDFDRYQQSDRQRMISNFSNRKYAFLFTSRGCPYLCNYCHDIFTKRFIYRSVDNVLEEVGILYEKHGVTELYIVDDIFNLHKPRVQEIMNGIAARWPGVFRIAFPNGLRGDILDQPTIDAMVRAGTQHAVISVETVTPRLQEMVEKYLDIDKARWAIDELARQGVLVQGAFMLGFPTETPEEIEATVQFAISSKLTQAHFFSVTPQPGTPIYDIALKESRRATLERAEDERDSGDYYTVSSWYTRAYGYDLHNKISRAFLRFYLHPARAIRLPRVYPLGAFCRGVWFVLVQGIFSSARLLGRKLGVLKKLVTAPSLPEQVPVEIPVGQDNKQELNERQ